MPPSIQLSQDTYTRRVGEDSVALEQDFVDPTPLTAACPLAPTHIRRLHDQYCDAAERRQGPSSKAQCRDADALRSRPAGMIWLYPSLSTSIALLLLER